MHRRTAVGHLAATVAGLSLGEVPELEPQASFPAEPFSVTPANLPESPGLASCAVCQETADSLDLTPAGLCLLCADRNPSVRASPHSDPFWILSPQEVSRLEPEIQRLSSELDQINDRLQLQRQIGDDGRYHRAVEAVRDRWHARQRELHLLQLLRAASRQFAR
jgi:hypothetical protein